MRWKRSESADPNNDGRVIQYDTEGKFKKFGNLKVHIYISSTGILSIFYFRVSRGEVKVFQEHHNDTVSPADIGYLRGEKGKTKKIFVVKVLDNGADRNETVKAIDLETTKKIAASVRYSIEDRKNWMLNLIQCLVTNYDFPQDFQQELQLFILEACTFLSAVKLTHSRIKKDERFWALTHTSEEAKSKFIKERGEENAELVYGYAKNLRSAINKLLDFASGIPISPFTVAEFEILTDEKKIFALLKSAATWLMALHREFSKEITLAFVSQGSPSQSYREIQSAIGGGKQEQADQSNFSKETTPLIGNIGIVPQAAEPEKSKQSKQEEAADNDCRSSCTIL